MKRSAKITIIAGISVTVIIVGLALFVHFKLSEIEKGETAQERAEESAEDIARETLEVLSGREPHSEEGEASHSEEKTETHSEEESAEERAKDLP